MEKFIEIVTVLTLVICLVTALFGFYIVVIQPTPAEPPYEAPANWCTDSEERNVYSLCGWLVSHDEATGTATIETEDGNIWEVENPGIEENDFLYLWFDDMGTKDATDDEIIKFWREVYE